MALSQAEKETIVRWSDDTEEPMTVYTHRKRQAEKLLAMGATLKYTNKIEGVDIAWCLEMPREWFKWPRKRRKRVPPGSDPSSPRPFRRAFGAAN